MTDYNLSKNEFVIMQEAGVRLVEGGESDALDEIVLTNLNLILVKKVNRGLFDVRTMLKRCPLAELTHHDDVPQVILGKIKERWHIQVPFTSGVVTLAFGEDKRRTAGRWADAIRCAAVGDLDDIQTEDIIPPEVANLVDGAKEVFGAVIGGSAGSKGATRDKPKRAARLTIKCCGCHAPMSGTKGGHAVCPYCDTDNTF